jgi:hypothetical protein
MPELPCGRAILANNLSSLAVETNWRQPMKLGQEIGPNLASALELLLLPPGGNIAVVTADKDLRYLKTSP